MKAAIRDRKTEREVLAGAPDGTPRPVGRRWGFATWVATLWLLVLTAAAALADLLPLADPTNTRAGPMLSAPTTHNWLGTDQLGRDLLARTVYGSRVSIVVGLAAVVIVSLVGGTLGIVAGYLGRRTETVVMFVADVLLAFPALLLSLAVVTFTDSRGPITVIAAIALIYLGPTMRIVRGLALAVAQREFVLAARSLGASPARVITREIVPNVLPAIFALGFVAVAGAMVAEGGLAYLNLSVAPPTPTWGAMMASGVTRVRDSAYPALVPAGAMFLTILSLVVVGDRLQTEPGWPTAL